MDDSKSGVIDFILSRWNPFENDREFLSILVNYFKSDLVLLGIVDLMAYLEGSIDVKFEQFVSDKVPKKKIKELEKVFYSGAFKESFENRKVIVIEDYTKYEKGEESWKSVGLKNLVSVPIIRGDYIFGVLQIGSFNSFDREKVLSDAELFSKTIALVLSEHLEKYKLDIYSKTEQMHIKLSSSLKENADKPLNEWLEDSLRDILEFSGAEITGFMMPSENIYCVVDKTGRYTSFFKDETEKVRDWIAYKLFKMGIKKIVTYKEAIDRYGIEPSLEAKKLDIVNGLFVPVEYGGELIASFAYGFKEEIKNIGYHKIFLKNIGFHLVMAIFSYKRLKLFKEILTKSEEKFILSFMKMSELRDSYTHGHSERVALYAKAIGDALGYDEKRKRLLYVAGILHDIGKVGIPDSILLKPGKLSRHEYEIIKYHSVFSYEMVRDIDHLKYVANCIRHHHERCDGKGYPDGLECGEIEECAKILAIADVFDALTSERLYRERKKYTPEEALKIMKDSGLDMWILNMSREHLLRTRLKESKKIHRFSHIKEIEKERVNIFFKDYLTGADRLTLFSRFVEEKIRKGEKFILLGVDVVDLGYINYRFGVDFGNKLLEALVSELSKNPSLERIMRAGADSFICLFPSMGIMDIYSFVEKVEFKIMESFLKSEMDEKYRNGILYKTHVSFPEEGNSLEDLLYRLMTKLKKLKFIDYNHI